MYVIFNIYLFIFQFIFLCFCLNMLFSLILYIKTYTPKAILMTMYIWTCIIKGKTIHILMLLYINIIIYI